MADIDREPIGVGSTLVAAVVDAAWKQGCRKLSVVTSNDNVRALSFYQRRGTVEKLRRIKPEIPKLRRNDIPIRDELELALDLGGSRA